jgi:TatD DNase family protein
MMFEIGVNLTSSQFASDRQQVVERARTAGLNGMLITGTDLPQSLHALELAQQYADFCWSTAGVHPHQASSWSAQVAEQITQLAASPKVLAIGECGLDFNRNFSPTFQQEAAFTAQLAIAADKQLPVFLHCRDAHSRFMALLRPWLTQLPGAVIHCFTGNRDELDECLSAGLYIGITGWVCDERRGVALRQLLPHIPADRLLIETDAPYLIPRDLSPKPGSRRNEPCFLPHIARQIADLRNETPQQLAQQTEKNARILFGLC